ncbi:beta-eliminating lyase-related protein [Asticcacaulis sp. BYS171W]|uniref:Beta-eliminating lyase-related protein n=1 Tax=Asticcacaulis aquaticus TaxID=2984212 RepID=A0ABT5HXY1_9CAUL|nr:beta-eliminating lyase-related protein [Asticcacaulis aquaticus]MDC7684787.1 beta-eliminating lyase-related protein [Asticcacaulis aquaticus]
MPSFASDNTAPMHPAVLAALSAVNSGHMPSYGADEVTGRLNETLREVFAAPQLRAFPTFNGSATNGVALAAMMKPFEAVIATRDAHIQNDECGLPEFFTGAKILIAPDHLGKLTPEGIERIVAGSKDHAPHAVRPKVISLTQSTEIGTVYSVAELQALRAVADAHDLLIHMDGARLSNAVSSLGVSPSEAVTGVDILSFGGTKAGAALAEAVVIFNPGLQRDFEYWHKRMGQLPSKMRFVSAQLLALLEGDLWLELAGHANAMARRLEAGLAGIDGVSVLYPVEANALFVTLPPKVAQGLEAAAHKFYPWSLAGDNAYRLVCSFITTAAEVDQFLADCGSQ